VPNLLAPEEVTEDGTVERRDGTAQRALF
jgi:hypothetical protein